MRFKPTRTLLRLGLLLGFAGWVGAVGFSGEMLSAQGGSAAVTDISSDSVYQDSVYQDNVVVILDASGSMSDRLPDGGEVKMEAARRALQSVLSKVATTTHVGVLVFGGKDASGRPLRDNWIYPLGPVERQRLQAAIQSPHPDGKTWLGKFLKIGADRLLQQRTAQKGYGSYRLLVVTDGEANDPKVVDRHVPDILARGIAVNVIGVDMETSHTLATRVNSYRSVSDPAALEQAISEVIAEIGSYDARESEEAFELLQGFPAELASRVITALSQTDDQPIGERSAASSARGQLPSPSHSTSSGSSRYVPPRSSGPIQTHYGDNNGGGSFLRTLLKGVGLALGLFIIGIIAAVVRQRRYR